MTERFDKIKKIPAYRLLANAITERILDGRLAEGEQLPTEALLCEMFGVNRSTVREGIRVLEEARLLRREGARKVFISHPTDRDVGEQVERSLRLYEVSFAEVWEAMMTFEPTMAALAAEHGDPVGLARLDANVRATAELLHDTVRLIELATEFQGLVAAMSLNRALILAREPVSHLFSPLFHAVIARVPVARQRLLAAHQSILECIRNRDAVQAEHWMRKHVRDFRRGATLAGIDIDSPISFPIAARFDA
jgi:GntR family transcriptional regulator, transcriptional repressor for pyruvate dehydrogenase complex